MSGMSYIERWKVDLPAGVCGDWEVKHFNVSPKAASFESLRSLITGSGRQVPEGRYTGIFYKGQVVMSDTPDELRDHASPIRRVGRRGHVLINGLGLGMVAAAILELEFPCESCGKRPNEEECHCPDVIGETYGPRYIADKVTVIEKSEDVIALVAPTLTKRYGVRLEIIHADAFEYKPPKGVRDSVVWHDIWTHLCTDNLKGMGTLHRKYGRSCDWQGSWGKERLKLQEARDKRRGW